jgi:regulator of sigma E protease
MSAPFGVIDLYRNFRFCGIRLVERAMNITLLQGLIFFTVFTGMILIHEFGHFLAARLFKVDVEEFGFGLPPRLMKLFHWKGTDFTLNWLPLGGFVRPKGENDPNVEGGLAASSPWVRLGVLFAGPIMNLLAGLLVNSILFAQMGVPDMTRVMLYEVTPNSPAAQAGLQANDFIVAVDGQQVTSDDQFRALIQSHLDQPMQITVKRGDKTLDVTATPLSSRSAQEGALGILPGPPMVPAKSFFQAIPYGSMYTYAQMRQIVSLPVMLIRNQLPAQDGRFIGLKGIYDLFGQAVSRDVQSRETPSPTTTTPASTEPTNFTLQIIATLTLTLGIFNLLPFPALDGGRIMFVLPEIILRKRVPPELENVVNAIGFALLIAFMIYINAMDFINPVKIILP